jgi:hypothetical protein
MCEEGGGCGPPKTDFCCTNQAPEMMNHCHIIFVWIVERCAVGSALRVISTVTVSSFARVQNFALSSEGGKVKCLT